MEALVPMAGVTVVCLGLVFTSPVGARDRSVGSGINRTYEHPDVERLQDTLEGERRAIYQYSVDLALVCDVYHHFEFPDDSLRSIHQALREGGQLVVLDFERIQGLSPDFQLSHVRAGKGTVTDEIENAGFELEKEIPLMPNQYYLVFRKR